MEKYRVFLDGVKKSIVSNMLDDAFREMDARDLFYLSNGKSPFLLLEGHGSRS